MFLSSVTYVVLCISAGDSVRFNTYYTDCSMKVSGCLHRDGFQN
jgi:hypothetical protein